MCDVAHGFVVEFHQYFGIERKIKVYSRTEFDKPDVLVDLARLTRFGIGDDASGQGTCDLTHENFLSVLGFDDDGRTFVFGTRLGQPRGHVAAVLVAYMHDGAVHGSPVGMHVDQIHEYRDLHAFLVEIFIFHHLFGHNDGPIGRSHHRVAGFSGKVSPGRTEEIENQRKKDYRCDEDNQVEKVYRTKIIE